MGPGVFFSLSLFLLFWAECGPGSGSELTLVSHAASGLGFNTHGSGQFSFNFQVHVVLVWVEDYKADNETCGSVPAK